MGNKKNEEYSPEIRDILEKEPLWIIRNGMWIIIGLFSLVITGFFLFSQL
jgi:hypothetical protein